MIPADEHSNFSETGGKAFEASVSWSEIKFFKETRIIRNMHFAIGSCNASIRIDDNGRVVVNALGPLFKKGNNQYNLQLFGQL